ncbi:hypothetical protein POM88_051624 [Heracleum sosnowskyi]|uniref:Uncharacterized protein n=1 Tax=Heracleum sosnowskyi TaxID=360622 RepID=A0AAD8M3W0_9APIA|nr:hypothetical protein POM88_051624 [Heracleum sosnowskyi]
MDHSHSTQRENNLTTFTFRKNLYFFRRTNSLIVGSSGTTSDSVVNDHKHENIGSGRELIEEVKEKSIIRMSEKRVKVFPPLLSSLNRNGRPKFSLQTVREEGRLQIMVVPNHFSEVVRTPQGGDRVRMEFLKTGAD